MFDYSDPAGRDFLGNPDVATAYRQMLSGFYDQFSSRPNSAFTWLEAFDVIDSHEVTKSEIDWLAFPLTAIATDRAIDRDRFNHQDEYVEWRVESVGGRPSRITFVTQLPEYYQAFASVGAGALIEAIKDAIPGADPTVEDLFGVDASAAEVGALSPLARSNLFRRNLTNNPWNNGIKGILCLTQRFNTMSALFNLVAECGVLNPSGPPEDTCSLVGGACGPGRSSDPRICSATQTAVRNRRAISLVDPVGIKLLTLAGEWQLNGATFPVNDPATHNNLWTVGHNGRRATLEVPPGLTVNQRTITSGAQVSRELRVAAVVLTAPDSALPTWARIGSEGLQRGPGGV